MSVSSFAAALKGFSKLFKVISCRNGFYPVCVFLYFQKMYRDFFNGFVILVHNRDLRRNNAVKSREPVHMLERHSSVKFSSKGFGLLLNAQNWFTIPSKNMKLKGSHSCVDCMHKMIFSFLKSPMR